MKLLRKLAGLFMADKIVMLAVPLAALLGWLLAPLLPRALVAIILVAILAIAFSAGVLRAARRRS